MNNPTSDDTKAGFYSYFIWLLAILFFFYEFFLRVLPATVAKNIISSLDISLEQFAFIGSAYYIVYSFMQIPVGLLLDRFSARVLITLAAVMCSIGTLWFSFAQGFTAAFIARLLIGFGSAFGFVSLLIVTLNWFPRRYFAFLIGCGQFLAAVGPLCAGGPIALALKAAHGDWRIIFLGAAGFGIILSILIGLFLRGKPASTDTIVFVDKLDPFRKRMKSLLSIPQVWFIMSYAATTYVALPLLGAFWGTSYLETRGFSKPIAALLISMIWLGLAIGCPVFGKLSDKLKRRKIFLATSSVIGAVSSFLFLFTPSTNEIYLGALFFLTGFAGSGQNLSFAVMTESAPSTLRATALGLNNSAIMGFAAIVPPIITSVMQHFSGGKPLTESSFEQGLLIIPVLFSISILISLFGIKETFCRQQNEIVMAKRDATKM